MSESTEEKTDAIDSILDAGVQAVGLILGA